MTLEIFLFVLNFIEFVVNLQTCNDSTTIVHNPQYHIADNLTGLRTKREYTRWGADANTDASVSQFLVRVYDEGPPTKHPALQNIVRPTTTSPIIPLEDIPGKLLLGSVIIPVKTQSTEPWKPAEVVRYSRFMQLKPESAIVTGSGRALDEPDNLIKGMPFPRLLSQMTIKKPQVFKMTSDPLFDDGSLKVPERSEVNWSNTPGSDDARDVGMFHVNDQPKRMPEDESLLAALGRERVMDVTMHEGQGLVTPVKYNRRKMQGIVTRNPGYRRRIEDGHFELDDFNLGSDANSDGENDEMKYSNVHVTGKPMSHHNHISHPDLQNVDDIDIMIDDVKIETQVNGEKHEFDFARTQQPGIRPSTKRADSRKLNKKVVRPPHEPKEATHSEQSETEDIDIELYIDKEEADDGNENVRIDAEVDGNNQEFEFTRTRPGVEPGTRMSDSRKTNKKVVRPPHEPKKATHSEQRDTEDIYLDVYIDKEDGENESADVRINAEVYGEEREFEFTHTLPGARAGTLKPNSHKSTRILRPSTRHAGHRETEEVHVEFDIDEKEGFGNEDIKIGAEVDGVEKEFEFTPTLPGARSRILKPNSHKATRIIFPSTRHPGHRETEDIDVEINIDEKEDFGNEDIKIGAEVDGVEKEFEFTRTLPGARAGTLKPNSHKSTRIILPPTRHPGHRETEDIDVEIDINEKEQAKDIRIDADVDGKEAVFNFTNQPPPDHHSARKPSNQHKTTKKHVQPPREPNTDMMRNHDDNVDVTGANGGADDGGGETTISFTYPGHTTSPHNRRPVQVTDDDPSMYSDNEESDTTDSSKQKAKTNDQPKGRADDYEDDSEHSSDEKKVSYDESDTDKESKIDTEDKNTSKSEERSSKTMISKPDRMTIKEIPTSTLKSTSGSEHSVGTDNSGTTAIDNTLTTQTTIADIDEHKSLRKFLTCNVSEVKPFTFLKLHKLEEVMGQIKKWGDNYLVAKTVDIANGSMQTYMGNTIIMLIVDDKSRAKAKATKNTVLIVAGIQGRDHHSVAAAMYLLYELIERGEHHADLLAKFRFWVIPIFNPDGYQYSMSFPNTRNWRKNLKQMHEKNRKCDKEGFECITSRCKGVHLDRNFDYQWVEGENVSQLNDPCSELYPGPRQLSEPETRILTRYLNKIRVNLHAFIALKEGDVLGVMFPYSHTKNERTTDFLHRKSAQRASMAATTIADRRYVYGQTSQFLPLYAGGIEDWMEGHLGVENAYSITLNQPSDTSSATIKQVCHEGFAAINTLLLTERLQSQLVSSRMRSNAASPLQPFFSFDLNCFTFKLTDRISSIPRLRMFALRTTLIMAYVNFGLVI